MFLSPEDSLMQGGPTWHGTALGWDINLSPFITRLTSSNERFCGIKYSNNSDIIFAISAYLPTSGKDDDFSDVLAELTKFIEDNLDANEILIIGVDSNQSEKSSRRRTNW